MSAELFSLPGAAGSGRSEAVVSGFVAFLGVVMAFGIEALLPALDLIDDEFDFAARGWSVSLVVTVMLAGMGFGQVLWGPLSDSVGRVPALSVGLLAFVVGAVGTVLAGGPVALLAARFVWGVGAAAPNGLRLAVARDCVEGEALARVITLGTAVFLIAPVVMPVFGEAVLLAGPWEAIPALAVLLAVVAVVVAVLFGETLPRSERVGFGLGPLGRAVAVIARTRASAGAILATVAFSGSFFVFLGSAQPIVDDVFGRDSQFVLFFAVNGISMAVALVVANRSIGRFGRARLALLSAVLGVVASCAGSVASLQADGVPPVGVWLAFACAQNAAMAVVTALAAALALQPLGGIAGTGASVLAFGQLAVGGLLAAVLGSFISTTVTPMFVGAVVYGLAGTAALAWSIRSGTPAPVDGTGRQP
jgi:DHA1 family bicyclomycin/chloramphenicol resistance-like MFS transporter